MTTWGAFSKDYINTRILEITLNQIGPGDSTVTINWYFIGRDYDAKRLFVYDQGEFTGKINRGGVKLLPYTKELIATREKLFGGNRLTGSHPWGWCVIVSQNGRPLEEKASIPELIKWTREHLSDSPPVKREPRNLQFIPQALGLR
jgi:hypothetical protein